MLTWSQSPTTVGRSLRQCDDSDTPPREGRLAHQYSNGAITQWPLASVPFTAVPTSRAASVLLCTSVFDIGHHRAFCSTGGALMRRGFAAESLVAQISSQRNVAGPRCSTTHRRTSLGGGCRRIDPWTPQWCHIARGWHPPKEGDEDGVALQEARRRKERTCPELPGNGRARLVVKGGRFEETETFLWSLTCWQGVVCAATKGCTAVPKPQAAWCRR